MSMKTVHDLRKNGWKVKVGHHRLFYRFNPKTGVKSKKIVLVDDSLKSQSELPDNFFLSPKGGVTKLHITSPDGVTNLYTLSYCNENDYYNKKTGVKIALGRALKEINNPTLNVPV